MQTLTPGSILGHAVRRREDPRLVTGKGHYVDDQPPAGTLHAAFVRSSLAHAEIKSLDVGAAAAAPGVVAVFTAADLDQHLQRRQLGGRRRPAGGRRAGAAGGAG